MASSNPVDDDRSRDAQCGHNGGENVNCKENESRLWSKADVIAYELIEEPTAVRASVVLERHKSSSNIKKCSHDEREKRESGNVAEESDASTGAMLGNGLGYHSKSLIAYSIQNVLVVSEIVANLDASPGLLRSQRSSYNGSTMQMDAVNDIILDSRDSQHSEQLQLFEIWRAEFSSRIDGLMTVDDIGYDEQLLLVVCSDGTCTLIEIEEIPLKTNFKDSQVGSDSISSLSCDPTAEANTIQFDRNRKFDGEERRYYNVMCSISIDDKLVEKCTRRSDSSVEDKRLRSNGCLLGSASESGNWRYSPNYMSLHGSGDSCLSVPLCLYEGILNVLQIYTCESVIEANLCSGQRRMVCMDVQCVDLDNSFDKMRRSEGRSAAASVPDQSIVNFVVSCCFITCADARQQVHDNSSKDLLALLACEESYRTSDITCYCFEVDKDNGKLSEIIWSLGNLHPTTRMILNVQGQGDFLVAVLSSQGLLLVASSNEVQEIRLQMSGIPLSVTCTVDDYIIVGDSLGSIYFTDLQSGQTFRKLVLENCRSFSVPSTLLHVPENGRNGRLFIGSEKGDSYIVSLPSMRTKSDAPTEIQNQDLLISESDVHVVISSLSPVIRCKSFETSTEKGELNLAMLCGSGPSSSLRVAHFGASLQSYATADVFRESFPDRPRLLSLFTKESMHTHLLMSFPALNETQALDATGDSFCNVDIAGFDHSNATLATGSAEGDFAIQVTPLSVRLLKSIPEWSLADCWSPQDNVISVAAVDCKGRIVVGCAELIIAVEARNENLMETQYKSLGNQVSAIGICQSESSTPLVAIGTWLQNNVEILKWPTFCPVTQINTYSAQPRSIQIIPTDKYGGWGHTHDLQPSHFDLLVGSADGSLLYWLLNTSTNSDENIVSNPQIVHVASSEVNLQILHDIEIGKVDALNNTRKVVYANSEKDAIVFKRNGTVVVERVDGQSRMSIVQFSSEHGKLTGKSSLIWLSHEGFLSIGNLDFSKMLQSKFLSLPGTLRFLEYLNTENAFIVIGEEDCCDNIHVVLASEFEVVATMSLEPSHKITSTLVIRYNSSTELLIVASSLSDTAESGLISVFEVEKGNSDNDSIASQQWKVNFHGSCEVDSMITSLERVCLDENVSMDDEDAKSFIIVCGCPSSPQIRLYNMYIDIDLNQVESALEKSLKAFSHVDNDLEQVYDMLVECQRPIAMKLLTTISTPHGSCITSIKSIGKSIYVTEFMAGIIVVEIDIMDTLSTNDDVIENFDDSVTSTKKIRLRPDNVMLRLAAMDRMHSITRTTQPLDKGDSLLACTHAGDIVLLGRNFTEEADCLSRHLADRYRSYEDGRRQVDGLEQAGRNNSVANIISEGIPDLPLLGYCSREDLVLGMCPGLLGLQMHSITEEHFHVHKGERNQHGKFKTCPNYMLSAHSHFGNVVTFVTSSGSVGIMSPFTRNEFDMFHHNTNHEQEDNLIGGDSRKCYREVSLCSKSCANGSPYLKGELKFVQYTGLLRKLMYVNQIV